LRVELFDFELPEHLIALRPAQPRDSARMLVVNPGGALALSDSIVSKLADALRPGDALVLNDTRVIRARLRARRERPGASGATIEVLLHLRRGSNVWRAFARPAKRLKAGDVLRFGSARNVCLADELEAIVSAIGGSGEVELTFSLDGAFLDAAVAAHGEMPLPPYIASARAADGADVTDYQTVYAAEDGAVAAPTAGLHFTDALFSALDARGVIVQFVTLHVGAGTFVPVKVEDTEDHRMHAEWGRVSESTAHVLNAVRAAGGRIVAGGTTSLRILESAAQPDGTLQAFAGETDIFITPGYRFRTVDALFTNFHLPKSTLFMLVSAFCGRELALKAYQHAIAREYRFYSYGDCCLFFPEAAR
jgi:S-adenosylmethionine:tRNA ribosyltransferase-isomerase